MIELEIKVWENSQKAFFLQVLFLKTMVVDDFSEDFLLINIYFIYQLSLRLFSSIVFFISHYFHIGK